MSHDAGIGCCSHRRRLRYFKPNGKKGTLIIGNYLIVPLAVARRKRDEAKALLLDNLDPMEGRRKPRSPPNAQHCSLKLSRWSGMRCSSDAYDVVVFQNCRIAYVLPLGDGSSRASQQHDTNHSLKHLIILS